MASTRLKNEIVSAFKMHGLTLRSEASRYLVEVLLPITCDQRQECLDRLVEAVQKQPLNSAMVDRGVCEYAVQECNAEQMEDSTDKVLTVIDAFSVPRFTYHGERRKFIRDSDAGKSLPVLHAAADVKSQLFRDRYTMLHQRTCRHDLFAPSAIGSIPNGSNQKFQLKPVEFLLGSTAKLGEIIVLGMLTQLKERKWYLEDTTGAVQLDLSRANFQAGLFTDSCFVLAEGWYEDEVFHVNAFGFPPPEKSHKTMEFFGNINFFGGPSSTSVKASKKLLKIEQENEDAMFVFLSDVWLDQIKVMDKLRLLFSGYSEMPPTAFVLCGNFISVPYGGHHGKILKEHFKQLADMIAEFPSLVQNTKFIFVPGPKDPGPGPISPRPPIPDCLTEDIRRKIASAIFATNPCRIQYCTQEIIVFREDIVMKMCRNCVRFPSDGDIPSHFSKTLISQGHLCPLPLYVAPVYWAYDNALSLYPLPDLIVCADKYDSFTNNQADVHIVNPGSFPRSDFSFKVYIPASRQVEDSQIGDE